MDITELEPLVRAMQAIAEEANIKRSDFGSRNEHLLKEQALGEVLGTGKCLQVFVDAYPAEMDVLTAVVE